MPDQDPFQVLWTQQQQEPFNMSLAEIHDRASRFQSRVRRRNITEYAAGALVLAVFGWMTWLIPDPVVKAGAGLIMAGTLYVMWKLHSLARAGASAELDRADSVADYHRAELVRQRRALATVWRWYLAPFVPGILVFVGGVAFAPDMNAPLAVRASLFATSAGVVIMMFAAIAGLNAYAARKLDAEIRALDAARHG